MKNTVRTLVKWGIIYGAFFALVIWLGGGFNTFTVPSPISAW